MVILSLPCLISGFALAKFAPKRVPARQAAVESAAGCLIILGVGLIGAGLPLFQ